MREPISNIEDYKDRPELYKLLKDAREAMINKEELALSIALTRLKIDFNMRLGLDEDIQALEKTSTSSTSTVQ
tara:strand:+ start:814 stop:1032 length:219 start_codon:yes stop_codon:yes gene_type:complete